MIFKKVKQMLCKRVQRMLAYYVERSQHSAISKWWHWLCPTHLRSAKLVQALFALARPWHWLRYYVIADPADNSVTLSKALFGHIKDNAREGDEARVFVFKVEHSYGFMTNPGIEQPTQMCDIQYNDKYRSIGFETLCPSVGQILYSYHLPATHSVKLSVSVCHTPQGKIYYQIERPHAKHIRKHP